MPGPLPNPNRRRRNAPTIPTTELPAGGRRDPAPDIPEAHELGNAGRAWWVWAWSTPQACGWSDGDTFVIARRASLEDDLATIAKVDNLDLVELLDAEMEQSFRQLISRLVALCGGRLALFREMRDLDDRLGLTPKGLANLRWTIVEDRVDEEETTGERPLDELTVKELKKLVAERRVKLVGRPKKADLIAALEGPAESSVVTSLASRRERLTNAS